MAGFTFGLSALSQTAISIYKAFSILFISILSLIAYALHSHHRSHPIVKTDLLQLRTFRVSVTGNLISRLGFGGIPFLIPLFLQIGLGFPAQVSGLLLAPIALGVLLGKPFTLHLLQRLGYKRFLILNTVIAGFSISTFACISIHTPFYVIGSLTFLYGVILTLQYSAMNSLAYSDLAPQDLSAANSIMSTLQQIAQSFGVAVSALLLHLFLLAFTDNLLLAVPIFHYTFLAIGLLTLISSCIFIQLKKEDGRQMLLS